ncbi:MAG: DUF4956 domain-containing protein [Halanaerobiales bacterium]|nr:DUF4956 domain-containing protein [Halanaerobiales bacterium]
MGDILSFGDIIKKSFLKSDFFGTVNFSDILIGLIITFIISMYIFYIYKKTFSGVIYNHNFNVALVMMSLITSVIIMSISSNLVLSLGMVGALSIVRFRTAIKDPMDIIFMFWAIALGLTTGARLYMIAIVGSIFIGIIAILLMRYKNSNNIFMLIVHYEEEAQANLFIRLAELDYKIKSKTVSRGLTELTLELKIIGSNTIFVDEIAEIEGIQNTSLISYNGNFMG